MDPVSFQIPRRPVSSTYNASPDLSGTAFLDYTRDIGEYQTAEHPGDLDPVKVHSQVYNSVPSYDLHERADESDDENPMLGKQKLPPKDYRFYLVLVGLCVTWMAKSLDETIVTTIGQDLATDFDDLPDIAWFASAYTFPQAILMVTFGKISTMCDLRFAWLCSITIYLVGSVICIVARSGAVFIIGRAASGLGVAASSPFGLAILASMTTAEERSFYIAAVVSVEAMSLALGAILGGVITEMSSFRICFVLPIPLGVISLVLVCYFYRPPQKLQLLSWRQRIRNLDPLGGFLFGLSILLLLLGLESASEKGSWTNPQVIVLLVFFVIIFAGFICQQRWGDRTLALIPTPVLNREVILSVSMGFCVLFAFSMVNQELGLHFQAIKGVSVIGTGVALLPSLVMNGIGSIGTGFALKYSPYVNPYMIASTIMIMIGSAFLATTGVNTSNATMEGFEVLTGTGIGMGTLLGVGYAQQHVPSEFQPLMLSLATMIQLLGTTIGATIGGSVFNTVLLTRLEKLSALTPDELRLVLINPAAPLNVRGQISDAALSAVLSVYAQAVSVVFWIAATSALIGLTIAIHQRWIPLRK